MLVLLSLAAGEAARGVVQKEGQLAHLFIYEFHEFTKNADADYRVETQVTLEGMKDGSWSVSYSRHYLFFGCAKAGFAYTDVWTDEVTVPAAAAKKFFNGVAAIDFSGFPLPKSDPRPLALRLDFDMVRSDRKYFAVPMDTARGKAVWARLRALGQAMTKAAVPPDKIHLWERTLEGDFTAPQEVALAELRAHPLKYDGKRVRVTGWCDHYPESWNSLSVKREDEEDSNRYINGKSIYVNDASTFSPAAKGWEKYGDGITTLEATYLYNIGFKGGFCLITKVEKTP